MATERKDRWGGRSSVATQEIHRTGLGAASRPPVVAGAFQPTPHMRLALNAVLEEPALAANKTALGRASGLGRRTLSGWFANAGFRAWWNRSLLDLARDRMGEASIELHRLLAESTSDVAKVRAIEALVRLFGQPQAGVAEAVTVILEKWGRGRARMVSEPGGGLAVEIESGEEHSPGTAEDSGAAHKQHYQNNAASPPKSARVVSEAMALPPDMAEAHAARVRLEARVREGAVYPEDLGVEARVLDPRDPDLPRTAPGPSTSLPTLSPSAGVGSNHKPAGEKQQDLVGTPPPNNPPCPPGQRLDFRGLPYAPRAGDKAPPGCEEGIGDAEDPFA